MVWDDLRELAYDMDKAWAIVGDFNFILHAHEKIRGANSPNLRGIIGFSQMMEVYEFIDVGLQGYLFT